MRIAIRLIAVLVLLSALPARGQWTVDGTGVCTDAADQGFPVVIPDGAGGWFVAWNDGRNPGTGIYVQRLDAAGAALWTSNGVAACSGVALPQEPRLVSDGTGGLVVTWVDKRSGGFDVYAQRINSSGATMWTAGGVTISAATGSQYYPRLDSDGAGGAIITWTDYRVGSSPDVYAQRVNSSGAVQWTTDGAAICALPGTQYLPIVASDNAMGAIITWMDNRTAPNGYDIYTQRVNSLGERQWTTNGVAVCATSQDQQFPVIVADGSSGAIIAWSDQRGESDIYVQRVNSSGAVQWAADGLAVCTADGSQSAETYIGIIPDGSGGAILTWDDTRAGAYRVYAQRVNGGVAQWTADGAPLCTSPGDHLQPVITADGMGGGVVTWFDTRNGTNDIYAQRVSSSGAPQWTADGIPLCTASGSQAYPAAAGDGSGGAVVMWEDERAGNRDIYAQRVLSNGHATSFTVNSTANDFVTGTLSEAIAQANAIPGPQTIRFDIPGPGPHMIEVFIPAIPTITDALTIDGFTQPGSSPNTRPVGSASDAQIQIEIMGWQIWEFGFDFQATGTVRGVAIAGFSSCISAAASNVVIEGNYIGTDHTGNQSGLFGQQMIGIALLGDHCRVGGSTPAARNVVGYHNYVGVLVYGATNAEIYGNHIGVGADAVTNIGGETGIRINNDATGARVGSSTIGTILDPSQANVIMNNYKGVVVDGAGSINNLVAGNSILGNSVTIDLGNDTYTLNDQFDADDGPNGLQNYPVLSSAVGSQIIGTMDGAPNAQVYLHFYWSPNCCLNAAHYVGGTLVTLDGSGLAPYTFSPPAPIPPAAAINATATDIDGNTSEVSYFVAYQNTGSGSSQAVTLMNTSGKVYGSATFSSVTNAGNTYTTNPYTPPTPVSGFSIGNPNDPQIYFNITTDASYTGGVDICLNYDESNIPGPEANLVLLHYEGSMWTNVTTSRDLVNNKICGHATTLSPFVIGAATTTGVGDTPAPTSFALHTNVPNPFNPVTTIAYDVPGPGADVNITVFDVVGRRVRALVNEHRGPGVWSVQWNGEDDRGQRVSSGVYFYRMQAGSFVETKKMVLLK